jgi:hypothetical protein
MLLLFTAFTSGLIKVISLHGNETSLGNFTNSERLDETYSAHPTITLQLFSNGQLDMGVDAVFEWELCHGAARDVNGRSQSSRAISEWAAKRVGGFKGSGSCQDCTLYDETARTIESCEDILAIAVKDGAKSKLWVVPPEKW